MSRDERHLELVRAHRAGDGTALAKLAAEVAPLARWVSKQYSRRGVEREDLVGEAWLGFMEAVGSYDEAKGTFANHCATWMRARVSRAVTAGLGSSNVRRAFWNGARVTRELEAEGEDASDAAVAERLGVKEGHVTQARAREVSLDPALPAPATDLDGMLDDEARVVRLRAAVEDLPPRMRQVVECALEGRDAVAELGVSKQRVSQIRAEAIKRLREEMR